MKRLSLSLAVTAALMATSAMALDTPRSSHYDSRIQYVDYNDGDVVLVRAAVGLGARVVFAPGEQIQDVASGFSQGWQFIYYDDEHVLYILPKSIKLNPQQFLSPEPGKWDTNVMVKTNRRLYDLDLELIQQDLTGSAIKNRKVAYRVQFKYPADELALSRATAEKKRTAAKMDAKPAPMNWKNYTMQIGEKSKAIAPSMVYDDGRFTYLRFPNNRDFPAAFIVSEDGTEGVPNYHIDPNDPDVLVIHRVLPELGLRLGDMVVGVYNESFDADGLPPTAGTTVPGVKRVLKSPETMK